MLLADYLLQQVRVSAALRVKLGSSGRPLFQGKLFPWLPGAFQDSSGFLFEWLRARQRNVRR